MNSALVNLAAALRARRAIIADQESRRNQQKHMARLADISAEIEKIETSLPERIDPQLAHFLQRRSYDKALEFIENTIQQSAAR